MTNSEKFDNLPHIPSRSPQGWRVAFLLASTLLCAVLALIAILLVRTGFFRFNAPITNVQYKALWTFLAAALGAAVTLIGLILTHSHNVRTLTFQADVANRQSMAEREVDNRQKLETVVKSLELVSTADHAYAVPAQVAGSLAALVHLGHPVIAMRTLHAAWSDGSVDVATAVWLINEVLDGGSPASQKEASHLLCEHASDLCDKRDDHKGEFEWPELLYAEWPTRTPRACRFDIIFAIVGVLTSRDEAWWEYGDGWSIVLLHEAMKEDSDPVLKDCACHLLEPIIKPYAGKDMRLPWRDDIKEMAEIGKNLQEFEGCGRTTAKTRRLVADLETWRGITSRRSTT